MQSYSSKEEGQHPLIGQCAAKVYKAKRVQCMSFQRGLILLRPYFTRKELSLANK